MILYRVDKNDITEDQYANLADFAFANDQYLFFTCRATAARFGSDIVEINPVIA